MTARVSLCGDSPGGRLRDPSARQWVRELRGTQVSESDVTHTAGRFFQLGGNVPPAGAGR